MFLLLFVCTKKCDIKHKLKLFLEQIDEILNKMSERIKVLFLLELQKYIEINSFE